MFDELVPFKLLCVTLVVPPYDLCSILFSFAWCVEFKWYMTTGIKSQTNRVYSSVHSINMVLSDLIGPLLSYFLTSLFTFHFCYATHSSASQYHSYPPIDRIYFRANPNSPHYFEMHFRFHLCTCTGFVCGSKERLGERHKQSWI